jgi:O-antigen ligase
LYGFIRIILLALFALSIPIVMRGAGVFTKTILIISSLAILQAGIGMYQFSEQASLGLGALGEPTLVSYGGPTSTIQAEGGRLIRSYGTFPHPNIYGGFLMLGLIGLCYLYLLYDSELYVWRTTKNVYENFKIFIFSKYFFMRLAISAGMFVVLLGLITSLSRGAWLGAIVALAVMTALALWRGYYRPIFRLLSVLLLQAMVLIYIFYPIIAPRAQLSVGQPAVDYRVTYNKLALNLINTNAFGVGVGNQVLHSVNSGIFANFGLNKVWEWEPIHNLYLLIGSEIGLMGLLSFIGFLAIVLWHGLRHSADVGEITVLSLLLGVMTLGLFDHYLWTIQPGKMMLWLVIGLALSHFTVRQVWFIKERR